MDGYRERVFYYDSKGRAIQRVECDEDGDNLLRISNKYDFAGNIVAQRESYTYGGKTDDLDRTFSYDTRDRLVKETARLNNGEQAVVNHTYDDLGQLRAKPTVQACTPSTRRWTTTFRVGLQRSRANSSR